MGEFRGISPAERDRLVQAMGDKLRIEESSWTLNCSSSSTPRRSRSTTCACAARSTWRSTAGAAAKGLARISTLRAVGGVIRPGSPYATPEAELVKLPGFSKDIAASRAEAKKLLAEAGVPNLSNSCCTTATSRSPTRRPASSWSTSWRQIGVTAEHKQFDTAPYLAGMNNGNFDVAIDFSNLFMDEPSLGLAKYVSFDRSPENQSRSIDRELDTLYDAAGARARPGQAHRDDQAFEKRLFEQAYQVPLLWWHRIVPTNKVVMGWKMSPSHNLGQDLGEVWLNQ